MFLQNFGYTCDETSEEEEEEEEVDCEGSQPDAVGICGGDCPSDVNSDGVCDLGQATGCIYYSACNYNPSAIFDDQSCLFPIVGFDCSGNLIISTEMIPGCTYEDALNFSYAAEIDNGTCTFPTNSSSGPCYFDADESGVVGSSDLIIFLQNFGFACGE
jgi:hypothetical protein